MKKLVIMLCVSLVLLGGNTSFLSKGITRGRADEGIRVIPHEDLSFGPWGTEDGTPIERVCYAEDPQDGHNGSLAGEGDDKSGNGNNKG